MLNLDQRPGRLDTNAQLLLQLAGQGPLDGFALLHLAAGELPQAALMLVLRALGDQHSTIGTANHRRGHMHRFHPCTSCRAA